MALSASLVKAKRNDKRHQAITRGPKLPLIRSLPVLPSIYWGSSRHVRRPTSRHTKAHPYHIAEGQLPTTVQEYRPAAKISISR
jgi:hypothetical protein